MGDCRTITIHHRMDADTEDSLLTSIADTAHDIDEVDSVTVTACRDCDPPTLRDLLAAAHAAGFRRDLDPPPMATPRWVWHRPGRTEFARLLRSPHGWTLYVSTGTRYVHLDDPTPAEITVAARLLGVDLDGTP